MKKKDEALEILSLLGMPRAQRNDRSAWTLLALLDLRESAPWKDAKRRPIRIHDMIQFIRDNFGQQYAENSRETIRRQTIHQLEQAAILERNPDDPTRPTNSPNTVYQITADAYSLIKSFGGTSWKKKLETFLRQQGRLKDLYEKSRKSRMITVNIPNGSWLGLSPGKHNELQRLIIHEFLPRFCPKTLVLYVGDTVKKLLHIDKNTMKELNIPINQHGKLPDVVLFDRQARVLFLIEAVTAHGPVSPKRQVELEKVFKKCPAKRVYISAFLDSKEFKRHLPDIAWDTEVWIYETPEHMVHFNGPKFFTFYQ